MRRRVSEADGAAAFAQVRQVFDTVLSGEKLLISAENRTEIEQSFARLPRGVRATAVRYALEELATLAPGNSVEVRAPSYPRHSAECSRNERVHLVRAGCRCPSLGRCERIRTTDRQR